MDDDARLVMATLTRRGPCTAAELPVATLAVPRLSFRANRVGSDVDGAEAVYYHPRTNREVLREKWRETNPDVEIPLSDADEERLCVDFEPKRELCPVCGDALTKPLPYHVPECDRRGDVPRRDA